MGFAKGSTHPTSPVVYPTGKSLNPVQPLREKYFASPQTQITFKILTVSFPQEGRFAVVTDVGSGMRWTRQHQARKCWTKDAEADGEVVWS
jgi:hypothetical protein